MDSVLQAAIDTARDGDYAAAASICADLIEEEPEQSDAWQVLRELVELELEGEACFEVARALEAVEAFEEAIGWWRKGLEGAPRASRGWRRLGLALFNEDQYDEAADALAEAAELLPEDAELKLLEGLSLEADGRYLAARGAYLAADMLDPLNLDTALRVAGINMRLRRYKESIAALLHASSLRPDDGELQKRVDDLSAKYPRQRRKAEAFARRRAADAGRWCNGAISAERRGERELAIQALERALAADPEHATSKHLLAAYTGQSPEAPPQEYVTELFDYYADHFDAHLVGELGYRLPEALSALARRALLPLDRVLDLGCGTGLLGPHVSPPASRLVGVDLSSQMLNRARSVGLYDALVQQDAVSFLTDSEETFDAIFAAELFLYIGALDAFFAAACKRLARGGALLCSVERLAGDSFALKDSGRYAHSVRYVQAQAQAVGLSLSRSERVPMRRDGDGWEEGDIFLITRP